MKRYKFIHRQCTPKVLSVILSKCQSRVSFTIDFGNPKLYFKILVGRSHPLYKSFPRIYYSMKCNTGISHTLQFGEFYKLFTTKEIEDIEIQTSYMFKRELNNSKYINIFIS